MSPCMCGDIQCSSCGPAQGNWKCPICHEWADNCCEHISEETGDIKPEYAEEAYRIEEDERAADDAYAAELERGEW